MNSEHLTDEQMDLLLSDPLLADTAIRTRPEHLQVCADCSAEFESLLMVTRDLRYAATASARQHRSAARLREPIFRMPRMGFAALAFTAILCIAGPLAVRHKPARIAGATPPVPQMRDAVSDAQLLSEVQNDVSSQVAQPMLPLAASVASNGATISTNNSNY